MVALVSGKAEGIEGDDAAELELRELSLRARGIMDAYRSVCENGLGILEAEDDEDEDFASGGGRAKSTAVGNEDEDVDVVDAMAR